MTRWNPYCLLFAAVGLTLLLAIVPAGAGAQTTGIETPLPDPGAEAHARKLMAEIRCVVCQAQSIAESDAAIAGDMRRLVRELVAAGNSDADIRAYLTQRYGDFVLFKPPFKAVTMLLWVGPFALLIVGFGVTVLVFRRGKDCRSEATLSPEEAVRVRRALEENDITGEPSAS